MWLSSSWRRWAPAVGALWALGAAGVSSPIAMAAPSPKPAPVQAQAQLAWGGDPAQRLDVYTPPVRAPGLAPVIFMVHGGGWRRGDKASVSVLVNKVPHWTERGVLVVSINYRMLPEADVATQARDVAQALAWAQAHAADWGGDPQRFVLMGHSAGAHLVALLAANPALARAAGAQTWQATVALDSAAMDVEAIMSHRHLGLYDRAFGQDPAIWRALSPLHQLQGRPQPMLLVCSTRRDIACEQAQTFAEAVRRLGGRAQVLPQALSHGDINELLGLPGPYTDAVDDFLRREVGW